MWSHHRSRTPSWRHADDRPASANAAEKRVSPDVFRALLNHEQVWICHGSHMRSCGKYWGRILEKKNEKAAIATYEKDDSEVTSGNSDVSLARTVQKAECISKTPCDNNEWKKVDRPIKALLTWNDVESETRAAAGNHWCIAFSQSAANINQAENIDNYRWKENCFYCRLSGNNTIFEANPSVTVRMMVCTEG